jgi:hypothetical protein
MAAMLGLANKRFAGSTIIFYLALPVRTALKGGVLDAAANKFVVRKINGKRRV